MVAASKPTSLADPTTPPGADRAGVDGFVARVGEPRPNQRSVGLSDLSARERDELADLLEAELARL